MTSTNCFQLAKACRDNAYAPYSNFPVGAALRTAGGQIFGGANVENAAYPEGLCAEAAAIAAMISGGAHDIAEILIIGGGPELCTPCGGCRQMIREFAAPAAAIHVCGPDGFQHSFTLGELLPFNFGPHNLGRDGA